WAIDWEREVSSHDPAFYRWTQWLFLKFFEHGLAYRKEAPVNWCPNDLTVVANEYVVDGRCERCGAQIELRNMTQWFFKPTAYAGGEARAYARHAGARRAEERETEAVKTGVFTGHYATNPVNDERLPIYVADYVLMDYGTGAIMAVPAHDDRDREFAETSGLP